MYACFIFPHTNRNKVYMDIDNSQPLKSLWGSLSHTTHFSHNKFAELSAQTFVEFTLHWPYHKVKELTNCMTNFLLNPCLCFLIVSSMRVRWDLRLFCNNPVRKKKSCP